MFNVRPDVFWSWFRDQPPTDDPSGFPYRPSTNDLLPPDVALGFENRPPIDGNSFGLLGWRSTDGGPTLFGSASLPPHAASLMFPRMAETLSLWPDLMAYRENLRASPTTPPPGFNVQPPEDDTPGFRVQAPDNTPGLRVGIDDSTDSGLPLARTDTLPPTGVGDNVPIRPIENRDYPFRLPEQVANTHPISPFNSASLPPYSTSFLFPQMGEQQLWQNLQSDGVAASEPNAPGPSVRNVPPVDASPNPPVAGYNAARDVWPYNFAPSSLRHQLQDDTVPLLNEPGYSPALQRDPGQKALRQITRLYAGNRGNRFDQIDRQTLESGSRMLRGDNVDYGAWSLVAERFDPRHIVPTNSPVGRPPGIGHNNGPPLRPNSPSLPTQPSRGRPIQGAPPVPQPPDSSAATPGAAAAADDAQEQRNEPSPVDPETNEKLEAWQEIVRSRGAQAPNSQYLGHNGINTWAGVRLNPRLPEPAAGWHYLPAMRHLRNGYRGELQLANRIVAALPNETVIHYGMPAGRQGADVISVSPNGIVSVWDSKWRSGPRSISLSERAHQSETSLDNLRWELRRQIRAAVVSRRLSPEVAAAARRNIDMGNLDIYTIGTGNAHGGVVESVRDEIRSGVRRR